MKLSKKDLAFGASAVALLLVAVLGTGKKLGTDVPGDTEHQAFFTQLEQDQRRQKVEQGCQRCHPVDELPQTHPHKQECMVCHQAK